MQQQLLEGTVNISTLLLNTAPQTMQTILSELTTYIASPELDHPTLINIVKALFYGLWNFDKMINQHHLSTAISLLPHSLPKQSRKNGLKFYQTLYTHLNQKWPFIDKHRINKFMQLIRYLMKESLNFCKLMKIKRSKADQLLATTIFKDTQSRTLLGLYLGSGLLYHVTDIYFEILANYCIEQNEEFDFHRLQLFETLLKTHSIEHFRHHIISQVYGKYKAFLLESFKDSPQELQQETQAVIDHFLELAKGEEKQLHRKNLYLVVAFFKSPEMNFTLFEQQQDFDLIIENDKKLKSKNKRSRRN